MTRRFVQEAASLAPKRANGSYPVVLITEGEGSSGRYSAKLIEGSDHVFSRVASYLNHPIDPNKPHLRPVESIAGRFGEVRVEERDGLKALVTDFTPRSEYAGFIEEFADILGLSIYCGAKGTELEDGRIDVEEFDADDPYRSVDIVVAAGRGGRFERATESLRLIESSLGSPADKPGVTSAPGEKKEGHMDKEIKALLEALIAKFDTFVTESKAAADAARAAEADADAANKEKAEAIEAYAAAERAISEAKLLAPQVEELRTAALKGQDVAPLITKAKAVMEAAVKAAAESAEPSRYLVEGANTSDDFYVRRTTGGI